MKICNPWLLCAQNDEQIYFKFTKVLLIGREWYCEDYHVKTSPRVPTLYKTTKTEHRLMVHLIFIAM
jgi:hypothetical protein